MSDDLERAAKTFVERPCATNLWSGHAVEWSSLSTRQREEVRSALSPALLSFLDMDEAGVERVACSVYGRERWPSLDKASRALLTGRVRAVLSELRKMAGEKDV